jgi:hypothetical protein
MTSFFDAPKAPGALDEATDLYAFVQSAIFYEADFDDDALKLREELFSVWRADEDIVNGGFAQFFANSSGDGAEEAVLGFRRFGLPEFADLLEEVYAAIGPRPVPADFDDRLPWLEAKFGDLGRGGGLAIRKMAPLLWPYDRRYYDLKAKIDAEHEGSGFLWRLCRAIDARRRLFFPDAGDSGASSG